MSSYMPPFILDAFTASPETLGTIAEEEYRLIHVVAKRSARGGVELVCTANQWPMRPEALALENERLRATIAELQARIKSLSEQPIAPKTPAPKTPAPKPIPTPPAIDLDAVRNVVFLTKGIEGLNGRELEVARLVGEPAYPIENITIMGVTFTPRQFAQTVALMMRGATRTATLRSMPGFHTGHWNRYTDIEQTIRMRLRRTEPAGETQTPEEETHADAETTEATGDTPE